MNPQMRNIVADWPPVRFRPTRQDPDDRIRDLFRYDAAKEVFIPDDGQAGLAFYGFYQSVGVGSIFGNVPFAWGHTPPSHENVLRQWVARGIYHLALRQQPTPEAFAKDMGVGAVYRDLQSHPNVIAYEKAIHECSSKHGCCNGDIVNMENMASDVPLICAYCKNDNQGHKIVELRDEIASNDFELAQIADGIEKNRSQAALLEKHRMDAAEQSALLRARMEALLK